MNWKRCSADGTRASEFRPPDPRLLDALLVGLEMKKAKAGRTDRLRQIHDYHQNFDQESEGLYRLERGLQSMKLATLKTVADALGVKVVELLKGY